VVQRHQWLWTIPGSLEKPVTRIDLRRRLLGEMTNIELRQKYLATRTPDWAASDLHLARERLLRARLLRGVAGLALVGAAGGLLASVFVTLTANETRGALLLLIALGSAATGGISFAVLAAMGFVVLGEVVGEETERPRGRGVSAVLSEFVEKMAETGCGLLWGVICGLLIGLLAWLADFLLDLPHQTILEIAGIGAIGGMMLAILFAWLVLMSEPTPLGRHRAAAWAALGPLPATTYFLSRLRARRRYLRK
jgi:hypothetical protein